MMYKLCFFRVGEGDVGGSVEDEDGDGLDEVCDEIAVPEGGGLPLRYHPQDGDDSQREGERNEQRHVMMMV